MLPDIKPRCRYSELIPGKQTRDTAFLQSFLPPSRRYKILKKEMPTADTSAFSWSEAIPADLD